ncbi:AIR carboxylase family protein, partial [Leptospira borgpetersenii serovar Hardjo-bovis]|nr:AIR carboxylase family protein [Leptospira borgpetersenii serovar Hardjo-bovis]
MGGGGGGAQVPGVGAWMTAVPVLGVPMEGKALNGVDSLLAIVQMPGGVPVG